MYYKNRRVVFTNHAIDRLKESNLDIIGGLKLFDDCVEDNSVRKFKDISRNMDRKYADQENIVYYRSGTHIITMLPTVDKFKGDDIWLVITITNQLASTKRVPSGFWGDLTNE